MSCVGIGYNYYIENSVDKTEFSMYTCAMINRKKEVNALKRLLKNHPVVGIIGARQVGKTTLARQLAAIIQHRSTFFDLENPEDIAQLSDPLLALKELEGLVIIDEVQNYPNLFKVIRVLVDRPDNRVKFLVLGSASPDLLRQSSETLAGRIIYHELRGFSLEEIGIEKLNRLWLRGGFPRSFLAPSLRSSDEWRHAFIKIFLERDIPQLGITIRSQTLHRFWNMLAHYHGQLWNASELGRAFGVADTTVRNYLDLLTSTFVVRQFAPWHENISKRQVKAPKIYVADSGILHTLLNIRTPANLFSHPKAGASWEGFIIEETIRRLGVPAEECFFWATHAGAELDLLIVRGNQRLGFEIKRTSSPSITPSMRIALSSLKLKQLFVIHAGEKSFDLAKKIRAVSSCNILKEIPIL